MPFSVWHSRHSASHEHSHTLAGAASSEFDVKQLLFSSLPRENKNSNNQSSNNNNTTLDFWELAAKFQVAALCVNQVIKSVKCFGKLRLEECQSVKAQQKKWQGGWNGVTEKTENP